MLLLQALGFDAESVQLNIREDQPANKAPGWSISLNLGGHFMRAGRMAIRRNARAGAQFV
ncbi:hypothetical protein R5W24_004361 [Gemmata sp. JC717]|uniref:hypothetical protein n=1 Tax=Gemmata algarum TaxID=2975278 RepID=UPI0021BB24ED|nr:hypothetical protein [Gemmata algarum]MDY3555222.1 hypothetical protein [Gemmata algarum]